MKYITILGSTGSIGRQTLDIVRKYKDKFKVEAMTAGSNYDLFIEQINEFKPRYVCMADDALNTRLSEQLNSSKIKVFTSSDRLEMIAEIDVSDIVVAAIVGISGLKPTIKNGRTIALANKEVLVSAGYLVRQLARKHNATIIPVDSEHSAIWQCFFSGRREDIKSIILTASGGAFRDYTAEQLKNVKIEDALKHPNWNMGKKVTLDSATLMNKGFEVIEAMHLFNICVDDIKVVIQPESIIHSMVEYKDNSVIAQLSHPSMLLPIQLAMTYPERIETDVKPLDFSLLKSINFSEPDREKFPLLNIAYQAAREGGNRAIVLNAADEIVASEFISNKIKFLDIPYYIEKVLNIIPLTNPSSLDEILEEDLKARELTASLINKS